MLSVKMSKSRSKMLVRLSQKSVIHYNNTDSVTVASSMLSDFQEKENIDCSSNNLHNKYENYLHDDLVPRNLSPIIPLSESQLNECISEELGEGVYAELLPALVCDKSINVSKTSSEDVHRPSTSSHIHQSNSFCEPIDLTSKTNIIKIQSMKNYEPIEAISINNLNEDVDLFDTLKNISNISTVTQNIISTELSTEVQPSTHLAHSSASSFSPRPSTSFDLVSSPIATIETKISTSKKKRSTLEKSIDKPAVDDNCPASKKPKRNRDPVAILEKQRLKHPLLPPCSCKKQCSQSIREDDRQSIWTQFWNIDRQRRRDFISRSVDKLSTASTKTKGQSRRHNTLTWSLNNVKVCKVFFLRTLGYTNDEAVQSVLKNNYLKSNKNPKISAAPDLRGREHTPSNKFPQEYENRLEDFIMKYNPLPSHYNNNHAPNRKYLPVGINFSIIYKDFKQHCLENNVPICSWTHFHGTIKKLNLSTAEISQDNCTKCKNHQMTHERLPLPCNCEDCKIIGQHLENKRSSRRDLYLAEAQSNNSEGKEAVFTVDMQKAICMPLLTTKDYYFSRKLVLFNESFVPPGKNKNAVCILWHEGESGRKAYNIASTYVYFIRKYCRDLRHLNFFLDNCNAQNKNKILFSALVRVINDCKTNIQKLKLEYFEPGHTYMAADAVHGAIAKKLKAAGEVYDLEDFVTKIKQSRKNLDVEVLQHKDLVMYKNDCTIKFPKDWNIQNLKVIEFRRGKLSLFAKNDYNGDFKEIFFLKKKIERDLKKKMNDELDLIDMIERESKPRGVNEVKKKELLTLAKSMPASRRVFYEALEVSDAPDLDIHMDSDL